MMLPQQSETTPLVRERRQASSLGSSSPQQGHGSSVAGGDSASGSPPPTPARTRLRRLHSSPINKFLSTGMDTESLRLSYASKLVLAAVEGRNVESAVDLLFLRGGFINPLSYRLYRSVLVCIILGHLALALWEGGVSPFPLSPAVAAMEVFASLSFAGHILLNLWTFGVKQYRDKKWHFTFTVVAIAHSALMVLAALAGSSASASNKAAAPATLATPTEGGNGAEDWWNTSRLALLGAHALRPMLLISNLKTIRRVFTNVLRTARQTGSILMLGAVVLAFYSVLGINLFNSEQVSGYSEDGDNFDSFGSALLSLFVLVTEENFPMVADPSFTQRPWLAFPFFVSFLLVFLVVILPLLLGIVLDAYAQQHVHQHERSRRKARNALLAAYFILDDNGLEGLSRDQLIGVLTAEAGVGISTEKAEQLWNELVPEYQRDYWYSRSYSVPLAADLTPRWKSSTTPHADITNGSDSASAIKSNGTTSDNNSSLGDVASDISPIAHLRKRSLPHGPPFCGGSRVGMRGLGMSFRYSDGRDCRLDVHGFLRLADLLHNTVVESAEEDDALGDGFAGGGGGGGERQPCFLAGYDDEYNVGGDDFDDGLGVESSHGTEGGGCSGRRGDDCFTTHMYPEEEDEEDEEDQCCYSGDEGGRTGMTRGASSTDLKDSSVGSVGGEGVGVATTASHRSIQECASQVLQDSRQFARRVVGQNWFFQGSRGLAIVLTALALAWTPQSQQEYDDCLGEGDCRRPGNVLFRREDLLRRLHGLALLLFLAEMMTKVLAVGFRKLWRRYWAHRFDLILLGASLVSYAITGVLGNSLTGFINRHPDLSDVVQLPRAMVVLRMLTVFPQIRRLLETMSTVAAMLLKIMVLYSCVSYSFAAVGMAIFADAKSDVLEPRYSFSTLPEACLALFFLTVSNNWNDLLYPLVKSSRAGRWSAIYLVAYMLLCATMMLDVLVGVVIEGFRVSIKDNQEPQDRRLGLEEGPGIDLRERSCAGSDSGNNTGDENDSSGGDGASSDGLPKGNQQGPRTGSRRGQLKRKASHRKFTQVKPEDMFRPASKVWRAQGVWDEEDVRELDESVKAVEERLHQAWVNRVRQSGFVGESV